METSLPLHFERRKGRLSIRLQAVPMGKDWCLVLTGGDTPHLGAAALAETRPDSAGAGSGISVMALPGHREDSLVRDVAGRASAALRANVAVCCGIHLDGIRPAEIQDALDMCAELTEEFVTAPHHHVFQAF